MNLKAINKDWISDEDLSKALGINRKICKILLEISYMVWTTKKKRMVCDNKVITVYGGNSKSNKG